MIDNNIDIHYYIFNKKSELFHSYKSCQDKALGKVMVIKDYIPSIQHLKISDKFRM